MTVGLFLYAAPLALWALLLGIILASSRSDASRRRIALILISIWLIFTAVRLWHEPAIEPLWLQYLLLVLLPAGAGYGIAFIDERLRRRRPTDSPTLDEEHD